MRLRFHKPRLLDVAVLVLQPDDVLVITTDQPLTAATAAELKDRIGEVLARRDVVIANGIKLSVLRQVEAA